MYTDSYSKYAGIYLMLPGSHSRSFWPISHSEDLWENCWHLLMLPFNLTFIGHLFIDTGIKYVNTYDGFGDSFS